MSDVPEESSDVPEEASDSPEEASVAEALRRRIDADPYCELIGVELQSIEPGRAETTLELTSDHCNFHGVPHGGAIFSLADAAFAAASNAAGETAFALEANVSYLEGVEPGTTLVATATETHRSRRTAEYQVTVEAVAGAGASGGDASADASGSERDRIATFRGRVYLPGAG